MFRRAALSLVALSLSAALPASTPAQEDSPLNGAWMLVEVRPAGEETVTDHEPGLFLFTETHYSMMAVTADSARADLPEEPSDAELAAAFGPFFANSGRYEIHGDTLTRRAYVAKVPNYMHAFPDNAESLRFRVEGDRLYVSDLEFPEEGFEATFRRVEGTEPPY